ncbi:MAG: hypothetical protein KGI11_09095 [Thaumarchaeota archaeon]|nr:hypothetical protein [Nitrososphaerota archaeon]
MCVAVLKPEGLTISESILKNCFEANPDGAGLMYADRGQLHIEKGFFKFEEFLDRVNEHQDKTLVLHCRIRTHGNIDAENCHPFRVNKKLGFVHNGTITGFIDNDKSDTWLFNETILQPLVQRWGMLPLFSDPIKSLVEGRIGWSKLIFLNNKGEYQIFNEKDGRWDNGIWYSNSSYLPRIKYPLDTYQGNYNRGSSKSPSDIYKNPLKGGNYSNFQYKKDKVETGVQIYLTEQVFDPSLKVSYKRYTMWEVVSVNSDYTVDCVDDSAVGCFLYNVPFHKFELFDENFDDISDRGLAIPNGLTNGWSGKYD